MNYEDEWLAEKSSDPRSNDELIRKLRSLPGNSDEADDAYTVLQARRDPEVIHRAQEMCRSSDASERRIGAAILSQTGAGSRKILQKECVDTLLALLSHDEDATVLAMAALALGSGYHPDAYEDARISPTLAQVGRHPDADVRYGVVQGLLSREDESAVNAMIGLSDDPDEDVRNWATFGLAQQIDADTSEIREALFRRLRDGSSEIRAEALLGLARRDDERVIKPLIRELKKIAKADNYWDMVFEAAATSGDSRLYPKLAALRKYIKKNDWFAWAIAACRIPKRKESDRVSDGADTTCPVCGRKNAFSDADTGFCAKCGWNADIAQHANPDLTGGWNRRSLNEERERWRMRLKAAGHKNKPRR
jgi:HEAT repeat protein